MTQVHLGINIRLQYIINTSEIHYEVTYTSTLPLNQEGILSTQFSALVFFSVSTGSSRLQVIFVFKSYSSSSHHRIQIISRSESSSLDWIQIITQSRSLLLDHHYWIWIITRSGSSLVLSHDSSRHRKFYRANPFSCWLQAYLFVGLWQPLYLTLSQNGQHSHLTLTCQKGTQSYTEGSQ